MDGHKRHERSLDEFRGTRRKSLVLAGRHPGAARRALYQRGGSGRRPRIGPCVIKAQVPAGKRGKAGGIKLAADAGGGRGRRPSRSSACGSAATRSSACWSRSRSRSRASSMPRSCMTMPRARPLILFSTEGGMDIEEIAASKTDGDPASPGRHRMADRRPPTCGHAQWAPSRRGARADRAHSRRMYAAFRARDVELLEINPLALLEDDRVVALDCKFVLDDAAVSRQPELAKRVRPPHDAAGEARRRGRPQTDRARRRRRRARQRRRAHHDDHGRRSAITAARPRTSSRSAARPTRNPKSRSSWCCPIPA